VFNAPEKYRLKGGEYATTKEDGNNGVFIITSIKLTRRLRAIISDGWEWEHVSVSLHNRCPTWEEMNFVKNLFWDEDDLVVQIHPPKSEYINCHPYCLHLWRKSGTNDYCETPPKIMVGI